MVNSRSGSPSAPSRDAQALGAGGEVAADRVDARVQAGDRRDEHAVADLAQDRGLVQRARARGDSARQPTPGVDLKPPRTAEPVDARAGPAGRVGVVHEPLQHAVLDERRCAGWPGPRRRSADAVKASGLVGSSTSVTSGDADLLAQPVGEQRAALQHGLARRACRRGCRGAAR